MQELVLNMMFRRPMTVHASIKSVLDDVYKLQIENALVLY